MVHVFSHSSRVSDRSTWQSQHNLYSVPTHFQNTANIGIIHVYIVLFTVKIKHSNMNRNYLSLKWRNSNFRKIRNCLYEVNLVAELRKSIRRREQLGFCLLCTAQRLLAFAIDAVDKKVVKFLIYN